MSHDAYDVLDDYGLDAGCPHVDKFVATVEALRSVLYDAGLAPKGYNAPLESLTDDWAKAHVLDCDHCKGWYEKFSCQTTD